MSENTLPTLLAWMQANPDLLGWDLISAMSPEQANTLLDQEHLMRIAQQREIDGIDLQVPIAGTGITHELSGYRLGGPSLALSSADFDQLESAQQLHVEGGTHVIRDSADGVLAMSVHDAMDTLVLTQQRSLVAAQRQLQVDLQAGREFELSVGDSLRERLAAGGLLQEKLAALGDEQRIYPLMALPDAAANPFLQVRHIGARLLGNDADERTALVLFGAAAHGPNGVYPSPKLKLPWLLPAELNEHSSTTTLLSSRVLLRATFAQALLDMLDGGQFSTSEKTDGTLLGMQATAGSLRAHAATYETRDLEFQSNATALAVADEGNSLHTAFEDEHVEQRWQARNTVNLRYRPRGGQWSSHAVTFDVRLLYRFYLGESDPIYAQDSLLMGRLFWPWPDGKEVTVVDGLPAGTAPEVVEQIEAFGVHVFKQALLDGLARKLTSQGPEQLLEDLHMGQAQRVNVLHSAKPHGLAMFGKPQGAEPSFAIVDMAYLKPGQRHTFQVEPAREGLRWSIESAAGNAGQIGSINADTGEYRAPPKHAMGAGQVRVLVVATDPATRQRSVAQVKVLAHSISVNPLIRICWADDEVRYSAQSIGGSTQWQVVDPQAAGRGTLQVSEDGTRATYTAAPATPGKTYQLDEIRLSDPQTGEQRSVHVLARQSTPTLHLQLVSQADGQQRVEAYLGGGIVTDQVSWQTPLNVPGQIDERGYLTPNLDAGERFILILGSYEIPGVNLVFEGHLLLPLNAAAL